MPTLVTFLENPRILIALSIGALKLEQEQAKKVNSKVKTRAVVLHEIFTSRSMILLLGGLGIGCLVGAKSYESIKPFFESGFKGALVLFLLEMGIVAGARLKDLKKVVGRLIALGVFI